MTAQEKLQEQFQKSNLSQAELSRLSGISESLISKYLRGLAVARPNNLRKLSEVLKCDIGDLVPDDTTEFVTINNNNLHKSSINVKSTGSKNSAISLLQAYSDLDQEQKELFLKLLSVLKGDEKNGRSEN